MNNALTALAALSLFILYRVEQIQRIVSTLTDHLFNL